MSVTMTGFVGFTVTIKKDLTEADYEQLNHFLESHPWYDTYNPGCVSLVIDGMCGEFARLVFIDKYFPDLWCDDEYYKLRTPELSNEIYCALNTAYRALYNMPLPKDQIEYALWFYAR